MYISKEDTFDGHPMIDLHGLTVPEAEKEVREFIQHNIIQKATKVIFITGAGNNSRDGIPRIKLMVGEVCRELGLKYEQLGSNAGRILVHLPIDQDLSSPPATSVDNTKVDREVFILPRGENFSRSNNSRFEIDEPQIIQPQVIQPQINQPVARNITPRTSQNHIVPDYIPYPCQAMEGLICNQLWDDRYKTNAQSVQSRATAPTSSYQSYGYRDNSSIPLPRNNQHRGQASRAQTLPKPLRPKYQEEIFLDNSRSRQLGVEPIHPPYLNNNDFLGFIPQTRLHSRSPFYQENILNGDFIESIMDAIEATDDELIQLIAEINDSRDHLAPDIRVPLPRTFDNSNNIQPHLQNRSGTYSQFEYSQPINKTLRDQNLERIKKTSLPPNSRSYARQAGRNVGPTIIESFEDFHIPANQVSATELRFNGPPRHISMIGEQALVSRPSLFQSSNYGPPPSSMVMDVPRVPNFHQNNLKSRTYYPNQNTNIN